MSQSEQIEITPGMQRYIDKNKKYLADRDRYIGMLSSGGND